MINPLIICGFFVLGYSGLNGSTLNPAPAIAVSGISYILVPIFCFVVFFRYILLKPPLLEENRTYKTLSGTTYFVPTPENTSCTGGTVTDISIPVADEYDQSVKYVLTIKELRTCRGFENLSEEQAAEIIQALAQLSALCYKVLMNELPSEI